MSQGCVEHSGEPAFGCYACEVRHLRQVERDRADRARQLRTEKAEATNAYDRDTLSERISGLTGGIGVISVGDFSETAALTRRQKVEDSLNATKAAIEEGIVPGGGSALANVETEDRVLLASLESPFRQMCVNAGIDRIAPAPGKCIDFNTGEVVDAFDAGIVDPVKVVKSSLAAAASVVSNVLSVGTLIVELPEEPAK